MSISRHSLVQEGVVLVLFLSWGMGVYAEQATTSSFGISELSADELVQEALHREIYGLVDQRDTLLAKALARDPDFGPAQWQIGRLRIGRQWWDVEKATDPDRTSPLLTTYESKRTQAGDDVASHLALANWCRNHDLPLQERAHLTRVLDLAPNHPSARERLGFRLVAGIWLSAEEFRETTLRREREAKAAAKWRDELIDIRRDLHDDLPARQTRARERLHLIQDVDAFPVMESVLSLSSEEGALAVIDAASPHPGPEAVASLIRHAVYAVSPLVRECAAEQLEQRPRESYVPSMLSEMFTPIVSRFDVAVLPNGRYAYQHIFEREGQDQRQQLQLNTEYRRQSRIGGDRQETLWRAFLDSTTGIASREFNVAQQNESQRVLNQRCAEALNLATHQQLPADPQRWWQWWDEENDFAQQGSKQVVTRQQIQQVRVSDRPQFGLSTQGQGATPSAGRAECFVAGTQVQTSRGPRPIEQIRVGDLVLAQDVESGELALKPVLRTTVRPVSRVWRVTVGKEVLETSGGHLFWVTGRGWARSRELLSGMEVRCLRGSLPQDTEEVERAALTYNLDVADFHTYFVGEQLVLTHDVTLRRPTAAVVPGWHAE
ncbi:MAG: polymorphic toxin-type HINT domain-containing protein [Pirellulaceae bacterium]